MSSESLDKLLCLLEVRLNAMALCEVARGKRLLLPAAENIIVHYILQGSGMLRMSDGSTAAFGPGTLVFVPRNCSHELSQTGEEQETQVWSQGASPLGDGMMKFAESGSGSAISTACGTISADCGGLDLFEHFREPLCEDVSRDPLVGSAFQLMLRELEEPRFGTRPLCEALMKQCMVLAVRAQMQRGDLTLLPLGAVRDSRLLRALLAIVERPAEDHSLDELAKLSGMSRSLFAERFAEAFERPPMDLLRQVRLRRAANMLRSTQLPVQVIGLAVGYSSRSYFSRAFRAAYGEDPKSFRERARSGTGSDAAAEPPVNHAP
ncbi:MAG TPA: AraC family transcriptional regulator [Allosphingosinicella sp.]|nr:AraC family transcriptional regulator [Allosphingosinicella sp.]